MEQPLNFTLDVRDFDLNLIFEDRREIGTDRFAEAVAEYFAHQFEPMGGNVTVGISQEEIMVSWVPEGTSPSPMDHALSLLREGNLSAAVPLLRLLLLARTDDDILLYNLGMAESDLGELDAAVAHLMQAAEIDPSNANAFVGLSVAQQRSGAPASAIASLEQALRVDPGNGHAHLNLGVIFGGQGRGEEAQRHLLEAARLMPGDQRVIYALAYALEQDGESDKRAEADRRYKQVIEMDPQAALAEQARRARSAMAERSFRAKSASPVRMDAVMYCVGALEKFAEMSNNEVKAVAFEIALLGQRGLDVNSPDPKYTLRSLPGNFSGTHLMSLMYVGFQQIAPSQDIGFDLSQEYATAQQMFAAQKQP